MLRRGVRREPRRRTLGSVPREPRSFVEGIYHLSSHGSDTRHLFRTGRDRATFLDRLALVLRRFDLGAVAYALLGNHYHAPRRPLVAPVALDGG